MCAHMQKKLGVRRPAVLSIMRGTHRDSKTVASLHRLEFYRNKDDWQLGNKESLSPPRPTEKARRLASPSQGPRTPTLAPPTPPPARGRGRGHRAMAAVFPQPPPAPPHPPPPPRQSRRSQYEAHCGGALNVELDVTYSVESDGARGASPPSKDCTGLTSTSGISSPLNTAFLDSDTSGPEVLAGSHYQHRALSLASLVDEELFLAGAAACRHSSPAPPPPRRSYASVAKAFQAIPVKVSSIEDRPQSQVNDSQLLFKLLSPGSKIKDHSTEEMNYEKTTQKKQDDRTIIQSETCFLENNSQNNLHHESLVPQDLAYHTKQIFQYPVYYTDLVPQNQQFYSENVNPNIPTYFSEDYPFEPVICNNDSKNQAYVDNLSQNQGYYDVDNVLISKCYPQDPVQYIDNECNAWDLNNNAQKETCSIDSKNLPLLTDSYFDNNPKKQLSVDSPSFYPKILYSGNSKFIPQSQDYKPNLDLFMQMFTDSQQKSEDILDSDAQNWTSYQCANNFAKRDSGPFKVFKPVCTNIDCNPKVFPHMENLNSSQKKFNNMGLPPGISNAQTKESELALFPNLLNEPNVVTNEVFYKKTSTQYGKTQNVKEVIHERSTTQLSRPQNNFVTNCDFINLLSCNPGQQTPFGNQFCSDYNQSTQNPFNETRNEHNPINPLFWVETSNVCNNAGFPEQIAARGNHRREMHSKPP